MKSFEIFLLLNIRTMAANFSPCKRFYVLNQFPRNVMFGMNGFQVSASEAIQGHHGPLFKKSALKLLVRFWNNFTEMFLVAFLKNCSQNFDLALNMAVVYGGYFHSMDMKKFLKNLLWNHRSDFEIISQICALGDPFQKLFTKFWSVSKHGISKWGLLTLYRQRISCKFFS